MQDEGHAHRVVGLAGELWTLQARRRRQRASLHPGEIHAGARQATALGTAGLAREIIERALETEWSPALVSLYAELPEGIYSSEREGEARARIQSAERWLRSRSRDPQLLATLGRLCMQAELWGKARSFLEASLSFDDSRAARLELARLAERLGQPDEAQRHYRKAAELP